MSGPAGAFLTQHTFVGLDTNLLIYFVQAHPRYGPWCRTLFEQIGSGRNSAVTSAVSLLEVLVEPYRREDHELVHAFYALLPGYSHLRWLPVTLPVADLAAQLRARYRLSTPDAIQIATALDAGATGLIGNDKSWRKVKEIECLVLDDVVKSH
jgi:predicted nucleic acid-binding protein